MPTMINIGAGGAGGLSPGGVRGLSVKTWTNTAILTNTLNNVLAGGNVYTDRSTSSLHNTIVYKNAALTQRLNDANFSHGGSYYYADATGWCVGVHNFNGAGDTFISGSNSCIDLDYEDCTLECFAYHRTIPTFKYAAYYSVYEPRHCQRLHGLWGCDNEEWVSGRLSIAIDYSAIGDYSTTVPGIMFSGPNNAIITHDNDTERPFMREGYGPGVWHHVAAVRYRGSIRIYVDGKLGDIRSITTSNTNWDNSRYGNLPFLIGGHGAPCPGVPGVYGLMDGFLSDLRILKGQALYTGTTYNVPLRPLTTTGHRGGSQNITGQILLLLQNTIPAGFQRTIVSGTS